MSWLTRLRNRLRSDSDTDAELQALSEQWNGLSIPYKQECNRRLDQYFAGDLDRVAFSDDPRTAELGNRVMTTVIALNRAGRASEVRGLFLPDDRSFEDVLPQCPRPNLTYPVILDRDSFLVRRGGPYVDSRVCLVRGTAMRVLDDVIACAVSSDRTAMALMDARGTIVVTRGFEGEQIAAFPWPDQQTRIPRGLPDAGVQKWQHAVTTDPHPAYLAVSDDGRRVMVADPDIGILVGDARSGAPSWRLVYPDFAIRDAKGGRPLAEEHDPESEDDFPTRFDGDMLNGALSPDGRFVAFGSQLSDHMVVDLDAPVERSVVGLIRPVSEYPHATGFSRDGKVVAFNSCYLYMGETAMLPTDRLNADAPEIRGPDIVVPLNPYRVYSMTWIPAEGTVLERDAFVLGGANWAMAISPDNTVGFELLAGTSVLGLDYEPTLKLLLLTTCNGVAKLLTLDQIDTQPANVGYRPPVELGRWIFPDAAAAPIIW